MFHSSRLLAIVLLAGALTITPTDAGTAIGLLTEARGSENNSELLAAVTASLKGSARAYVEVRRVHWDPGAAIPVRVVVSPVSGADMAAGRLKGNWEQPFSLFVFGSIGAADAA